MKFKIIAANNYAAASKSVIEMLKNTDQRDLSVNHVVISNDRCSMSGELEILDALGGSFNTQVLTFARLTSRIMTEKQFISKQSAIMLINRLAEEMKDEFLCFKKSYDTAGFAKSLYETISQLKYSAVSPQKINPDDFDQNLRLKMHDIKLIYQAYEDFIKDRYVDSGAKLQQLIKNIPTSDFIKNSYFYIKDFDNFSTQEILIIRELVIWSKGVVVAVPFVRDNRVYLAENFTALVNVADGLGLDAQIEYFRDNQSNFVGHIEDNLFAYKTCFKKIASDAVRVVRQSDVFAETEAAARYILDKTEEGARFKDFLVVAGDVNEYSYAIERVFGKYGIAYFLDRKVALSEHPLSRFIDALLRVKINNFRREDCLSLMKNYFYDGGDVCFLENFCLKNNLRFFGLPFDVNDEHNGEAEQMRKALVGFVDGIGLENADSVSGFTAKIKAFVSGDGIARALSSLADELERTDFASYKVSVQALEKITEVLDTLDGLFGTNKLSAEKFSDLLRTGLDAETISVIPLYNDCVVATNVSKSRANGNRHLIVLGANDGKFPSVKGDTKIIADGDIDKLKKHGVDITPKTESENKKEKFNVFQLLTAPRESLYISYISGGDNASPCLAAEEISAMFAERSAEDDGHCRVYGKVQARERFVEEASKAADGQSGRVYAASNLYYALEDKSLDGYVFTDYATPNLDGGRAALMPKGKTSITKLENFYRCPYGYFLSNGLKIKKRDNGEMKVVDTGTILHDVLENFVKKCFIDGKLALDGGQIAKMAEELIEQCLDRPEYQYIKKDAKLSFTAVRLRKEAVKVCAAVYKQVSQSSFKPVEAELAFGFEGGGASPIVLQTADGKKITLNGKIDRIDACGDKFVLIDYKTGNAKFDETQLYAGQKLQLLTYVKVAAEYLGKKCVGFFYMPVQDRFCQDDKWRYAYIGKVLDDGETVFLLDRAAAESGKSRLLNCSVAKDRIYASSKVRMSEEELEVYLKYTDLMMNNAVREMSNGFISRRPFGKACDFCDFNTICSYKDLSDDGVGDDVKVDADALAKAVQNV